VDELTTIKTAAEQMLEDHGPSHKRHLMWKAMSNLLKGIASRHMEVTESNVEVPVEGGRGFIMEDVTYCTGCGDSDPPCWDLLQAALTAKAYLDAAGEQ
jgi:hypothetical protein